MLRRISNFWGDVKDAAGDFVDWMADQVQTTTGEKDRRQLVCKLKEEFERFKNMVVQIIDRINTIIADFNCHVRSLNYLRTETVSQNIKKLSAFLQDFGKLKPPGAYIAESEKVPAELPMQKFLEKADYINEVDWSRQDVELNTFFLTPIGMMAKTRKQNLSMQEQLNEMKLEFENTKRTLELREYNAEQDIVICELYTECVDMICKVVQETIVPEFELVEAFWRALAVKNIVISESSEEEITARKNISVLKDTIYHMHYIFVKNAFLFYVISCKIYDTPVLTRLFNHTLQDGDKEIMENHKSVLALQANALYESSISRL